MKKHIISTVILFIALVQFSFAQPGIIIDNPLPIAPELRPIPVPDPEPKQPVIQLALLLDTSNSMDGLIEQAKSQLWKMVNDLANKEKDGQAPLLQIGLYEYGNDQLSVGEGYVRQILPLTTNIDDVSEKLFALKTDGGSEYCGWAIEDAVNELQWEDSEALKIIIIAGNEAFNQGPKNYIKACNKATDQDIIVNTIFCGNYQTGINSYWKDGADITKGDYFNIDTDKAIVHIPTPYDGQILQLNIQLNQTYLWYGSAGKLEAVKQERQDINAQSYSSSNAAKRAIFKSKSNYKKADTDLVDAIAEKPEILEEVAVEELPQELQGKTTAEQTKIIQEKNEARAKIQAEMQVLETKRQQYIAEQQQNNATENTLDQVLEKSINIQAKQKGFH